MCFPKPLGGLLSVGRLLVAVCSPVALHILAYEVLDVAGLGRPLVEPLEQVGVAGIKGYGDGLDVFLRYLAKALFWASLMAISGTGTRGRGAGRR